MGLLLAVLIYGSYDAGVPPILAGCISSLKLSSIVHSLSELPFGQDAEYVIIHSFPAQGTIAPIPHSFPSAAHGNPPPGLYTARCGYTPLIFNGESI